MRVIKYCTAIVFSLLILSGCATKKQEFVLFQGEPLKVQTKEVNYEPKKVYQYKIIPNDRISILFYNHPELSTRDIRSAITGGRIGILVNPDGTVRMPLIGTIKIAGLSVQEATNLLINEYSKYIKNAHLFLEVLNKRAYVLGEVKRPGKVTITNEVMSVVEVLSEAGGFTDFAKRNSIKIIRGTPSQPIVENIDLTRLDKLARTDLMVYPNDIIYVTPNNMRTTNLAIADMMPGLDFVTRLLTALYTGKELTNTYMFNVNDTFK